MLPGTLAPLSLLAALVGYSRIHVDVHCPTDVVAGAPCGVALAEVTNRGLDQLHRSAPG